MAARVTVANMAISEVRGPQIAEIRGLLAFRYSLALFVSLFHQS